MMIHFVFGKHLVCGALSLWLVLAVGSIFLPKGSKKLPSAKNRSFQISWTEKTPTIQFALTTAFDARYTLHTQREKHSEIHKR